MLRSPRALLRLLRQPAPRSSGEPPVTPCLCGSWPIAPGFPSAAEQAAYARTLGARPRRAYDRAGFLERVGVPEGLRASGRDDAGMFEAWTLTSHQPESVYLPETGRPALVLVQRAVLAVARSSPALGARLSLALDAGIIKDSREAHPAQSHFGDRLDGPASPEPADARYEGVLRRRFEHEVQHAFEGNFHEGSVARSGDGVYGTYDVAAALGFTEAQALRMARTNLDLDDSATPLRNADGRPRETANGIGMDLHFHFNRAAEGQDDTRLEAARYHLGNAVDLARQRKYEPAEHELGIGLHSLQDVFAHGQIAPMTHVLLGSFPDHLEWTPAAAYEAELATEGYLRLYLADLGLLDAELPAAEAPLDGPSFGREELIARAGLPAAVAARVPEEIRFFLTREGRLATGLGFGWKGAGARLDGRSWNALPAGYDARRRIGFVEEAAVDRGDEAALLRHELLHAVVAGLPEEAVLASCRAARDRGELPRGPQNAREVLTRRLAEMADGELVAEVDSLHREARA